MKDRHELEYNIKKHIRDRCEVNSFRLEYEVVAGFFATPTVKYLRSTKRGQFVQ